MSIQILFLLLTFTASSPLTNDNNDKKAFSEAYHYLNNITVKSSDGTNYSIFVNGNAATLFNPDGTQSTIEYRGNSSYLIACDGTTSTINHTKMSSNVFNSDGTRMIVNHMSNSSLCYTEIGKHTVSHTFGNSVEYCNKKILDVLIHRNWFLQQKAANVIAQLNEVQEEYSKEEEK